MYHILAYFVYLKYLMYIMYLVYLVHLMYLMYLVYLMYLHPFWTIFYLHILLLVSSHQANKTWTESLSFRQNMSTNEDSFKIALFFRSATMCHAMTPECLCVLYFSNLCCSTVNPFQRIATTHECLCVLCISNLCCSTAVILVRFI